MSSDLPELDQEVSYVVVDGEALGPFALAEIADSIAQGRRPADSYVWWVGASEWVPFNSDEQLVALLLVNDIAEEDDAASDEAAAHDLGMPAVPEQAAESAAETSIGGAVEDDRDNAVEREQLPLVIDLTEEPATVEFAEVAVGEVTVAEERTVEEHTVEEPTVAEHALLEEHTVEAHTVETHTVEEEQVGAPDARVLDPAHLDTAAETIDLDEISTSAGSVLASVGARLEALASSTRHYQSSMKLDLAGAAPVDEPEIVIEPEISDARTSVLGNDFDAMVRRTAHYQRLAEQSERVRELLSRGCAAVISQQGYAVERRTELRGHYFLNFEHGADTRRMRLEITPAPSVSGDDLQYVSLTMTWGRMAFDIDEAMETLLAQPPVAEQSPGVISPDADLDNGTVSTRINLVASVETYIDDDFSIDRAALQADLQAVQHRLEHRWYELFIPAE